MDACVTVSLIVELLVHSAKKYASTVFLVLYDIYASVWAEGSALEL